MDCNHISFNNDDLKGECCILCGEILIGYVFDYNIKNCIHKFRKTEDGYKCIYCNTFTELNPDSYYP